MKTLLSSLALLLYTTLFSPLALSIPPKKNPDKTPDQEIPYDYLFSKLKELTTMRCLFSYRHTKRDTSSQIQEEIIPDNSGMVWILPCNHLVTFNRPNSEELYEKVIPENLALIENENENKGRIKCYKGNIKKIKYENNPEPFNFLVISNNKGDDCKPGHQNNSNDPEFESTLPYPKPSLPRIECLVKSLNSLLYYSHQQTTSTAPDDLFYFDPNNPNSPLAHAAPGTETAPEAVINTEETENDRSRYHATEEQGNHTDFDEYFLTIMPSASPQESLTQGKPSPSASYSSIPSMESPLLATGNPAGAGYNHFNFTHSFFLSSNDYEILQSMDQQENTQTTTPSYCQTTSAEAQAGKPIAIDLSPYVKHPDAKPFGHQQKKYQRKKRKTDDNDIAKTFKKPRILKKNTAKPGTPDAKELANSPPLTTLKPNPEGSVNIVEKLISQFPRGC